MMRLLALAFTLIFGLEAAPHDVWLSDPVQVADSLEWDVRWNAPAPGAPTSSAPTGYEVELWRSGNQTLNPTAGFDVREANAAADTVVPLGAVLRTPYECGDSTFAFWTARVRATGAWDGGVTDGPWGQSPWVRVECPTPNPPPGPPTVDLDTIMPPDTGFMVFSGDSARVGEPWSVCAMTVRGTDTVAAGPGLYFLEVPDGTVVTPDADVGCWDVVFAEAGVQDVDLCWHGCDCCDDVGDGPAFAQLVPIFPASWRPWLFGLGVLLIVWSPAVRIARNTISRVKGRA